MWLKTFSWPANCCKQTFIHLILSNSINVFSSFCRVYDFWWTNEHIFVTKTKAKLSSLRMLSSLQISSSSFFSPCKADDTDDDNNIARRENFYPQSAWNWCLTIFTQIVMLITITIHAKSQFNSHHHHLYRWWKEKIPSFFFFSLSSFQLNGMKITIITGIRMISKL